ncbi:hypothetical protein HTZ77_01020 [Nonomuraea sp. SMC257]|uniref:Tetratricopeptide repeat protein n=1 Tax=Nonomuraea montanisoli TaxID=2741721 RepID=A0A7Y6M1D3_9ACTN|nr:hypothetical protein [Nonomuraea montanisoli]NUW30019.1 hypothetical protein [Nonomuraea montanisoli]
MPANPIPPDPITTAVPDEARPGLEAYRAGDVAEARSALRAVAGSGRTSVSGFAAAALAGIELGEDDLDEPGWKLLRRVAAGEDPWLGPMAAVLPSAGLYAAFESLDAGRRPADHPLVRGVIAQLTADPEAAEEGFIRAADLGDADPWTRDLAAALHGNLLLQTGADPAAAEEPLTRALKSDHELYAGYAGHLLGHLLIGQGDLERAGRVLQAAHLVSHPRRAGAEGLYPWVCVRYGELLAGAPHLSVVEELMAHNGMSESYWVREAFEGAFYFTDVSRPALAEIGLSLFPADFPEVRHALERLRRWSEERYDRARALFLALHDHVADSRDADRSQGLRELRAAFDRPVQDQRDGLPRVP